MITVDKNRDQKLKYDINREAAKISALSLGKIHKYEHLTCKEILPSDQSRIIEQATFACSPLGKSFEKQMKAIENQGEKQKKGIKKHRKEAAKFNDFFWKIMY